MTDQQYEPTTDDILRCYMQRGGTEEEFNRWYEAELTAAEQRGELRGKMEGFDEGIEHLSQYGYITIEVYDMAIGENPYRSEQVDDTHRADQMEL